MKRRRSGLFAPGTGLWIPGQGPRAAAPPSPNRLDVGRWLTLSELIGRSLTVQQIIDEVRNFDWRYLVRELSTWAAVLANSTDGVVGAQVHEAICRALEPYRTSDNDILAAIASALPNITAQPILHEQSLYFLLSLAILHGDESDRCPTRGHLVLIALAANDLLPDWSSAAGTGAPPSDPVADMAAELWRASRFNVSTDQMRDLARVAMMLEAPPPSGPLRSRWSEIQMNAFGMPFRDFAVAFLGPIGAMAHGWGRPHGATGDPRHPLLSIASYSGGDPRLAEHYRKRAWTRQDLRLEIRGAERNGLPSTYSFFYRKPFVHITDDLLCGLSPWLVHQFFHYGPAFAMLEATKAVLGKKHADDWFPAFGLVVEQWCRRVAREARAEAQRRGTERASFHMSDAIGATDELEDVVIFDKGRALLFSVKAAVAPEAIAKGHASNADILKWLRRTFVEPRSGDHRGGALRLLNEKVKALHAGRWRDQLGDPPLIVPVVVTYERLTDNPIFNRWLGRICAQEGLLKEPGVAAPTICDVAHFEVLMGMLAHGIDFFAMLGRWRDDERELSLPRLIHDTFGLTLEKSRLEFLSDAFGSFMDDVTSLVQKRIPEA